MSITSDISLSQINYISNPSTPLSLTELSPRDFRWDTRRQKTTDVELIYGSSDSDNCEKHHHYAELMANCSLYLRFRELLETDDEAALDGLLRLKLSDARFCRVRWCPICQWRKSLMWQAKAKKIIPKVIEAYPTYRWLMLTLTVKNIPVTELRSTIVEMNKSFQRFSELKAFPGEGWIKRCEVTQEKNRSDYAHPHFHILIVVKSTFFGRGYLNYEDWQAMWKKSARLDYDPQVDIRAIKTPKLDSADPTTYSNLVTAVYEVIKYQVKVSDLTHDSDWFLEMSDQLYRTRAISVSGILRKYFRELEEDPEDLVGKDDELDNDELENAKQFLFRWKQCDRKYLLKEVIEPN